HIIVDNGPGALLARPGPAHQTNGVVDDIVGHGNAPYQMLYGDDPLGVEQGVQGHLHIRSGGLDHLDLLGQGRVIQFNGEHETIELGLGQGVGTLPLYWVLGGQYRIGDRKSTRLNSSHVKNWYAALHAVSSFPTRRSSDLSPGRRTRGPGPPPHPKWWP